MLHVRLVIRDRDRYKCKMVGFHTDTPTRLRTYHYLVYLIHLSSVCPLCAAQNLPFPCACRSSAWLGLALQADVAKSSPRPRLLRASLSRRLRRGAQPWRRLPHDDAPRVLRPRPVRPHYSGALRLLPVRPRLLGQRVRSARLPLCLPLQLLLPTGRLLRCVPRHQCTEIAPCTNANAPLHHCTNASRAQRHGLRL